MTPRKHSKEIIAWAQGAVIQKRWRNDPRWISCDAPHFNDPDSEYRASIAEVEGRPVFEGDVLYLDGGEMVTARRMSTGNFMCVEGIKGAAYNIDRLSWSPPLPKTINVTIPRPTNADVGRSRGGYDFTAIHYDCNEDAVEAERRIRAALKEALK